MLFKERERHKYIKCKHLNSPGKETVYQRRKEGRRREGREGGRKRRFKNYVTMIQKLNSRGFSLITLVS
jgi:hypothetical protein